MEPFILLPVEKWPELQETFKTKDWPEGFSGYYFLKLMYDSKKLREDCHFKVYCPYGEINNGFVALWRKGDLEQTTAISPTSDTRKLEDALVKTSIINWKQSFEVPWASAYTEKCFTNLFSRLGLQLVYTGPTLTHFLSKDAPPFKDVKCPTGTYVGPVLNKHVARIDEVWPHREKNGSQRFFETLIEADADLSYGLYSKGDDNLLAWIFICEAGFMTHLYCEKAHRRHGYAEFLAKYVSNAEIAKGNDVFCYITNGNTGSLNLYKKLGYKNIGIGNWMCLEPKAL